ncbi:hypothetical protein [Luteococcus sp.]|uniref:hypothetical protein n=1 Tax=Luteococcus sp. TaxID=1969402 RepID=UPI003736A964
MLPVLAIAASLILLRLTRSTAHRAQLKTSAAPRRSTTVLVCLVWLLGTWAITGVDPISLAQRAVVVLLAIAAIRTTPGHRREALQLGTAAVLAVLLLPALS